MQLSWKEEKPIKGNLPVRYLTNFSLQIQEHVFLLVYEKEADRYKRQFVVGPYAERGT
jgi:hypothetical protein